MATKRKVFTLVDEEPDEEPAAKKARGRQGGRNRRRPPLRQTSWVCRPQKTMTYAVDTSICERGFALMNNLKTARRSRMGNLLLRTLMTICELGDDWKDAAKIPVDEIVEEWRSQSSKGRYESAMWRAAGLEEPNAKGSGAASSSTAAEEVGDADQGDFQYNWAARERARERAFPRARPGPSEAGSPEGADTDGDEV